MDLYDSIMTVRRVLRLATPQPSKLFLVAPDRRSLSKCPRREELELGGDRGYEGIRKSQQSPELERGWGVPAPRRGARLVREIGAGG